MVMKTMLTPDSARCCPDSVRAWWLTDIFMLIFEYQLHIMGKESREINSIYRWIIVLVGIFIAVLALAIETKAQSNDGFIYGKVHTDNATYTGALRWGTEEVLWTDLFNASKTTDQYRKLVPERKDEEESWLNIDWSFGSIWEDKIIPHQFNIQFGNLSQISVLSNDEVKVKLKNGKEFEIDGEGYNDVGSDIQVLDSEVGTVTIKWNRVRKVEFMQMPSKEQVIFGLPLYGTVETARREKFTGFIIWDNDERLITDRLDGNAEDGDVSIKFSEISTVVKHGSGSNVTLKSGREFNLTGSNDVNNENRGVLIVIPALGIVKVSWEAFRSATFSMTNNTGPSYAKFTAPAFLQGTVTRFEGDDLTGRIIFDIDEMLDIELIQGEENGIEYSVPLKNISKIIPKNNDYSIIELKNGKSLLLGGGHQDVTYKNGGLLVFIKGKKEPQYISWKKINEIIFN